MKTYLARFRGRTKGAIGIHHACEVVVGAEDDASARLKLYDTHEHIAGLTLIHVPPRSSKRYRCTQCGHETTQTTNHYGATWSWGHSNTCPACPPYRKYPEFGGHTVWVCLDKETEGVTT